MEDLVYKTKVFFAGQSYQFKRLFEILENNSNRESPIYLRYAVIDIANSKDFVDDRYDDDITSCNYTGFIRKDAYLPETYIIESIGVFPTELFKAIESQFPGVSFSLSCYCENGAFSHVNDRLPVDVICTPDIKDKEGFPNFGRELDRSLSYIARRTAMGSGSVARISLDNMGKPNLESVKIWVVKELKSIPKETPKVSIELWDPTKNRYSNPDLRIKPENMQAYFPNYYRIIEEQKAREKLEKEMTQAVVQPPAWNPIPQKETRNKKSRSIIKAIVIYLLISWLLSIILLFVL